jgi:hypothetical protein
MLLIVKSATGIVKVLSANNTYIITLLHFILLNFLIHLRKQSTHNHSSVSCLISPVTHLSAKVCKVFSVFRGKPI